MKKVLASISVVAALALAAVPAHALEEVSPTEAYELATTDPDVYILDVRTAAEWKWVGHPGRNKEGEGALLEGKVFQVSWFLEHRGKMVVNRSFLRDVDELFGRDPLVTLILVCRSGTRGDYAAPDLLNAGYKVLNMVPAFEGIIDEKGYRSVNGWKIDGLPYSHSPGGYLGPGGYPN